MKKFKIPIVWSVYSEIEVFADSKEQAIEAARIVETYIPVGLDGEYVEDSLYVDVDDDTSIEESTLHKSEELFIKNASYRNGNWSDTYGSIIVDREDTVDVVTDSNKYFYVVNKNKNCSIKDIINIKEK